MRLYVMLSGAVQLTCNFFFWGGGGGKGEGNQEMLPSKRVTYTAVCGQRRHVRRFSRRTGAS